MQFFAFLGIFCAVSTPVLNEPLILFSVRTEKGIGSYWFLGEDVS